MIELTGINEDNFFEARKLCVNDDQKEYIDSPTGIIARGYIYRSCNGRIIGIMYESKLIGLALVRDLDEEPACYDLQQIFIDKHFQNKELGGAALKKILAVLEREGKYNCAEVCVNRTNVPALRMFEKAGFTDTGYIDSSVPDCMNLMYRFETKKNCTDRLISDFSDTEFQYAFKQYFSEMDIDVQDWSELFGQMNEEGINLAFLRKDGSSEIVGFIQFGTVVFKNWFFEETYGFIRELWVDKKYRSSGHGSGLLKTAEQYLYEKGIYSFILTTDTAEDFYLKNGYERAPGCKVLNRDGVFIKRMKRQGTEYI